MQAFKLDLPENRTVSGLHNIPAPGPTRPKYCPLIVGLHGGSYCSSYFDVDDYSARHTSTFTGVPFVAIDRPSYEQTTPIGDIPDGSSFQEEWGKTLHQTILPAIWTEFAVPNGCTSIVLHSHSLGTPGACVAAALHAKEISPAYPLAGISFSGFGNGVKYFRDAIPPPGGDKPPAFFTIPPDAKDAHMFLPGTIDPALKKHTARLNRPVPHEEVAGIASKWLVNWNERYAVKIRVPVNIGLAELDGLWAATDDHLRDFAGAFPASKRVDASLIRGAPHNLELSYWSQGWYARLFGFAMDVATSLAVEDSRMPN
ncbi:hypothetical protein CkaCkLH20_12796 [Colletotrichum karsti]|uniref:AB hydrolase-1 domain-containing protein n=1 Tax=Colletotrichum karsti TaxID=1095194 RepID=A0A9P6HS96_9PEZI|nr:uncharacterized protein CkaCkLH20_12796 [Colletotrichum karsti]KAF9869753.1 hypothetical protein CkaCkLH20_12796 [Colletotrichum karsti]